MLGWVDGRPLSQCDKCYELGPHTEEARALRKEFARETIEAAKKPENLRRHTRSVLVPLTIMHMTPEEREKLHEDIAVASNKRAMWAEVEPLWKQAVSYVRARMSGQKLPQTDPIARNQRNISCFGVTTEGVRIGPPCPMLMRDGEKSYCGACGCKRNEVTRLDGNPSKLDFVELKCPLGRSGFSNRVGPHRLHHRESVPGS